jgi:mRNA turnover protein 4
MRNAHLKTVRNLWKEYALLFLAKAYNGLHFASSARIFFGRGAVMAKALGTTPEEEHRLGLSKLATVRKQNFFPLNHRFNLRNSK